MAVHASCYGLNAYIAAWWYVSALARGLWVSHIQQQPGKRLRMIVGKSLYRLGLTDNGFEVERAAKGVPGHGGGVNA